ncbi:IclR family transcriptional regulator [Rhizobium herbae]|uniref:DNA-binding IclR family transcriptional regulator n=1 Tax=Rhizobium herbae TaxID=508661 RepID=A0ABS4ENC9_9HYPH|nr:IclR family transcriptional regulator [Rhizobium herbae]MBP1859462.1 DNA-binding IclR family transcriptional regulator [Rhizobium herbae]
MGRAEAEISPPAIAENSGTGTLGKALSVLETVVTSDRPLRFSDILAVSGQPRGTLHRQLSHLVEEGLLTQGRDLCYEPGLRLLKFAYRSWSKNQFRAVAGPHLRRLHEETGETVHLGVLRGIEIIYVDKVESRQTVRMESQIGNASPVYCTGLGKAALSVLPPDRLAETLGKLTFQRFTANTHLSAASLKHDLDEARLRGYAFDREEHETEIRCVAAPIHDAGFDLVAGISVTGPAYRVTMEQLEIWARPVRQAAMAISEDVEIRMGPGR